MIRRAGFSGLFSCKACLFLKGILVKRCFFQVSYSQGNTRILASEVWPPLSRFVDFISYSELSEWLSRAAHFTMLWLMLVLLSLAQPGDQKLFRLEKHSLGPDYYRFLNHGFKAGQVTREQAKLKVDILGNYLFSQ